MKSTFKQECSIVFNVLGVMVDSYHDLVTF